MRSDESNEPIKIAYDSARFMLSAPDLAHCPPEGGIEVAFAGRSNAGKSSALNALTRNSKLARTSRTPGRTQLINFFSLSTPDFKLVDLPGYGFAKVSKSKRGEWDRNMSDYLQNRESLRGLVLLMDSRHPLKDDDVFFLRWSLESNLPVHVVLTKADKLKQKELGQALAAVKNAVDGASGVSIQSLSATKGSGLGQLRQRLDSWYQAFA